MGQCAELSPRDVFGRAECQPSARRAEAVVRGRAISAFVPAGAFVGMRVWS